ncbi:MAG: hypothetical protein RLZZ299_500 [Pseudomonadota bacterium]|jgi:glycosyltransferase involved in cell wall biosynthesis
MRPARPGARPDAVTASWAEAVGSLSIVLPAYNEADNIGESVRSALAVLDAAGASGEVVVVDDGSRDGTGVRARAVDDRRVRVVAHAHNRGYGAALRTGFGASRCAWVLFTDADLQFDLAQVAALGARVGEADLVIGYRAPRRDPALRRLNGWLWTRAVNGLLGLDVRDVNCAFKLLPRARLAAVPLRSEGAAVNGELLARLGRAGARIAEVPVHHRPRARGRATGAHPRVVLRALRELASLYAELG